MPSKSVLKETPKGKSCGIPNEKIPMACVYCFQVGSTDCFKIGRTKNSGAKRLKNVAVGSPAKLTLHREIETQWPARLENHIHKLLAMYRTENGEFFNVTKSQLDDAILEASTFVAASQPFVEQAQKLRRKKPTTAMLDPSNTILDLHRNLKVAVREAFPLAAREEPQAPIPWMRQRPRARAISGELTGG